tara:strand:- start:745 stop:1029 length:285 start_codon:yes stop_codon:yes gene_type:complete
LTIGVTNADETTDTFKYHVEEFEGLGPNDKISIMTLWAEKLDGKNKIHMKSDLSNFLKRLALNGPGTMEEYDGVKRKFTEHKEGDKSQSTVSSL